MSPHGTLGPLAQNGAGESQGEKIPELLDFLLSISCGLAPWGTEQTMQRKQPWAPMNEVKQGYESLLKALWTFRESPP